MNANKALGDQATLERRDRLIDQVRSLGADGIAKIGTRLKVADVCGGNEHLFAPAIHRQAQRLARSMDDAASPQGSLDLVERL